MAAAAASPLGSFLSREERIKLDIGSIDFVDLRIVEGLLHATEDSYKPPGITGSKQFLSFKARKVRLSKTFTAALDAEKFRADRLTHKVTPFSLL